jgi:hypothetical protein
VNVPDNKEIEVVDVEKGTILAKWPVTTSKNNFPMSLDEAHHRLFVGAWTPPRLLVFDTESGKQIAALRLGEQGVADPSIVGATDDLFYDAARSRIYVLNARGAIDVFQQKDPDHYAMLASVPTPLKSQTGLFVTEWGRLFVGVPRRSWSFGSPRGLVSCCNTYQLLFFLELRQGAMNKTNGDRSFTHGGGHPLHVTRPNVSNCKNSG